MQYLLCFREYINVMQLFRYLITRLGIVVRLSAQKKIMSNVDQPSENPFVVEDIVDLLPNIKTLNMVGNSQTFKKLIKQKAVSNLQNNNLTNTQLSPLQLHQQYHDLLVLYFGESSIEVADHHIKMASLCYEAKQYQDALCHIQSFYFTLSQQEVVLDPNQRNNQSRLQLLKEALITTDITCDRVAQALYIEGNIHYHLEQISKAIECYMMALSVLRVLSGFNLQAFNPFMPSRTRPTYPHHPLVLLVCHMMLLSPLVV
jgi:tetratricopeptide (TPR) repeat protein